MSVKGAFDHNIWYFGQPSAEHYDIILTNWGQRCKYSLYQGKSLSLSVKVACNFHQTANISFLKNTFGNMVFKLAPTLYKVRYDKIIIYHTSIWLFLFNKWGVIQTWSITNLPGPTTIRQKSLWPCCWCWVLVEICVYVYWFHIYIWIFLLFKKWGAIQAWSIINLPGPTTIRQKHRHGQTAVGC